MSYNPLYVGQQSQGSSRQLVTDYTNASGSTAIPQTQACSINGSGLLVPLDVSSQSSWNNFVGYANSRISASSLGPIIPNGRLENITTSFATGTPLWVGTDGNPTNVIPSAGVNGFASGDMVIFMGVIVVNEANPSAKDIALFTQFIGVL